MRPFLIFVGIFFPVLALLLAAQRGKPNALRLVERAEDWASDTTDTVWGVVLLIVLTVADVGLWLAEKFFGIVELLRRREP